MSQLTDDDGAEGLGIKSRKSFFDSQDSKDFDDTSTNNKG